MSDIMNNIINFNAGEFKFDVDCKDMDCEDEDCESAGGRLFISDFDGESVQVFEIGDWLWTWSQIKCQKQLEPRTDYVFRFALQGGMNDTGDGQSRFIIMQDNDWDDRQEYPLEQSRFKPILSKITDDGLVMLRVYEIPFNSGESGMITFIFNAHHFVETIMPAKELEAYSQLKDYTYAQWWQENPKRVEHEGNFNGKSAYLDLTGAVINDAYILEKITDLVEKGGHVNLNRAVLGSNKSKYIGDNFTSNGFESLAKTVIKEDDSE
ncbi:MAG: hypothetical protein NC433_09535 [Clostridiales bacterium]|nr:hypothetical protein [Clostridiales bacterium]